MWLCLPLLILSLGTSCQRPTALHKELSPLAATQLFELDRQATKSRIDRDVRWLADDARRGRGPHTPQLAESAKYIRKALAEAGCLGLSDSTPELQPFHSIASWSATADSYLEFPQLKSGKLVTGQEFRPLPWSGNSSFELPLAFVGYGIRSANPPYDEFDGIDVRGKAVIVLRHEPQLNDSASSFEGRRLSQHGYLESKIKQAIERGAAAVLVCNDRAHLTKNRRRGDESADTLLNFSKERQRFPQVPILHVKRRWVEDLLEQSLDQRLDEIETEIDQTLRPQSFEIPGQFVEGHVEIDSHEESLLNVAGLIPGRGRLADQYIVIGAHYDHLGLGQFGSLAPWTAEIHNGADDNASGTAAILELARRLSQPSQGDRRSILIVAFSGEEMGLLGSQHYCRFPIVPLSKTVAMLNLDMIGRLSSHRRLEVFGVATAKTFNDRLDQIALASEIEIEKHSEGYGPSDHNSFFEVGVPVLHFFTGLHRQYHRPSDDADLVDINGIAEITELVATLASELAASAEPPEFVPTGQDLFSNVPDALLQMDEMPPFVRIGIEVSEQQDGSGLRVTEVRTGSAADRAQLRRGDWIEKINDVTVNDRASLLEELDDADRDVSLVIRRRQVRMKISLTL